MTLLTPEALAAIAERNNSTTPWGAPVVKSSDVSDLLAHIDAFSAWLESEEAVEYLSSTDMLMRYGLNLGNASSRAALAAIRGKLG